MDKWQLGAAINLDAVQSLKVLWGAGYAVANLFIKSNIQLATVPYMANCSIVAGESTGWISSLRAFAAIRSSKGFPIDQISFGYPGQHALPALLDSTFGPRWLGILACSSFIRDELTAERELHALLTSIASEQTARFILDSEQCQKMWQLAREIFLDSPVHHEYLRIKHNGREGENYEKTGYFRATMLSALRIWEMASLDELVSSQLTVRGFFGWDILVFYLTVVCGFGVLLKTDKAEIKLGSQSSTVRVTVVLDYALGNHYWESGYLMEGFSIKESVLHILKARSDNWKPGKAAFAPSNPVDYSLSHLDNTLLSKGEVNLFEVRLIKMMIKPMTRCYISSWFRGLLTDLVLHVHVAARAYPSRTENVMDQYGLPQWRAIAERLRHGIALFAPGILEDNDLETLILDISRHRFNRAFGGLEDALPVSLTHLICSDACHGGKEVARKEERAVSKTLTTEVNQTAEASKTSNDNPRLNPNDHHQGTASETESDSSTGKEDFMSSRSCGITQLEHDLKKLASRLWFCAYMEPGAQSIIRNIGPDSSLNLETTELGRILDAPHLGSNSLYAYTHVPTSRLIQVIAQSLAGRTFQSPNMLVLAMVAGGTVVGLNPNEHQPIDSYLGHCIYIIPGSIECPTRRIREVFEREPRGAHNYLPHDWSRPLKEITQPTDIYGDAQLSFSAHISGDTAEIAGWLSSESDTHDAAGFSFNNLLAIDNAGRLRTSPGCFKRCVKGQLTADEIRRVILAYPVLFEGWSQFDPSDSKGPMTFDWSPWAGSMKLVLAHKNVAVQRAILSITDGPVMLQLGQCVHCACRAALNSQTELLLV